MSKKFKNKISSLLCVYKKIKLLSLFIFLIIKKPRCIKPKESLRILFVGCVCLSIHFAKQFCLREIQLFWKMSSKFRSRDNFGPCDNQQEATNEAQNGEHGAEYRRRNCGEKLGECDGVSEFCGIIWIQQNDQKEKRTENI